MRSRRRALLDRISALSPQDFEHLTYDLLVLKGMTNVSWRTPGADGGRDLEGESLYVDLSEELRLERWYVECKRYSSAVDWPTVFGKLAYAENAAVDFLLLCTTSTLSPACKNEIARREGRRLYPKIRAWEGPQLERLVAREPILLAKYSLVDIAPLDTAALPLLRMASKAAYAAYGAAAIAGACHPGLEFSTALLELATSLLDNGLSWRTGRRFLPARDLYSWVHATDGDKAPKDFDSNGVRALLAAARFLSRGREQISVAFRDDRDGVIAVIRPYPSSRGASEIAKTVALLANVDYQLTNSELIIKNRTAP
jgi:Restriction endonuclease